VIVTPEDADFVMPFVLPALKDKEPKVRNHAVSITRRLKDLSALQALIELMEDRYELIRANAARSLGELGDKEACGALISQIENTNELVQMCCHESLVKLTDKDYGLDQEKWTEWWIEFRAEQGLGR
jgi:HEAT repeat protein